MNRNGFILLLLTFCSSMVAQSSIFDTLNKSQPGIGKITITQSPEIRRLAEQPPSDQTLEVYRIQVFSGNDQRKSKEEATAKQHTITEQYHIATYITFTAPFWRLRVGNFSSYEEAFEMMQRLSLTFPHLKKESYIIKEETTLHTKINDRQS